jgi:hypothetical protein
MSDEGAGSRRLDDVADLVIVANHRHAGLIEAWLRAVGLSGVLSSSPGISSNGLGC